MSMDAYTYLFVGAPIYEIPGSNAEDFDCWEFAAQTSTEVFDKEFEYCSHVGIRVTTLNSLETGLKEVTPQAIEETKQCFLRGLASQGITEVKPRLYLNTYISV
jgi:hypothetical protein